jgi:translation initiation factor IF-3
MAMGRRFSREPRGPQIRVNHRIRVPEVRVVAEDGSNLGVIATEDALRRAQEKGLDLVEVNPKSVPPVCKILDFGKYKYEEKKKQREAKRKQTVVEVKEVKLRPKTDDHDLEVKIRKARRFLEGGNKVKFIVRFRGREITHPERAQMQLDLIWTRLEDLALMEQRPTMEAKTMALLVGPRASERLGRSRRRRRGGRRRRRRSRNRDRNRGRARKLSGASVYGFSACASRETARAISLSSSAAKPSLRFCRARRSNANWRPGCT